MTARTDPDNGQVAIRATSLQVISYHLAISLTVLILLQSFKETISSIYYYNLVEMGLTPVIGVMLVFLLPLITGPLARRLGWKLSFLVIGGVMVSTRLPMGLGLEQPFHLVFSTVALVSSGIMMALFFSFHRRERAVDGDAFSSQSITASFGIALLAMIVFRIAGGGLDITIVPTSAGIVLSPLLSGIISIGLGLLIFALRNSPILDDVREKEEVPGYSITGGAADSWIPAIGLGGFLVISTSVIIDPQVITGWTGEDITTATSFAVISLSLFIFSLLSGMSWLMSIRRSFANPWGALLGNAILIGGAFNLLFVRISVGVSPGPMVWIVMVDLWVILDAMSDPTPFAGEPVKIMKKDGTSRIIGWPEKKKVRASPSLFAMVMTIMIGTGMIFVVLISFSLNWSFVPLGSLFKGGIPVFMIIFTSIFAIAGFSCSKGRIDEPVLSEQGKFKLNMGSPTTAAGKGGVHISRGGSGPTRLRNLFLAMGVVTMVLIVTSGLSTFFVQSISVDESGVEVGESITVVTYNILHGYSADGRIDPTPHLEELEKLDPDIVFLQEADSLLINEGNFDPGAFLAEKLKMHYFRGADPGLGNPGTAILSRFPLSDLKVVKLRSNSIQRIAVTGVADLGSMKVGLIGVHFGLEEGERREQFNDLFRIIDTMKNLSLIIGGDFNTGPHEDMLVPMNPSVFGSNTTSFNGTGYIFNSGWHSTPAGMNDPDRPTYPAEGIEGEKEHIDYLFFSHDLQVLDSGIEPGQGASDHRPVWASVRL